MAGPLTEYLRLKAQARMSAENRGHELTKFKALVNTPRKHTAEATCKHCNMGVVVNDNPAPNEISVGGEAVALHCKRGASNGGSETQPTA
jgi:hypothetical protein